MSINGALDSSGLSPDEARAGLARLAAAVAKAHEYGVLKSHEVRPAYEWFSHDPTCVGLESVADQVTRIARLAHTFRARTARRDEPRPVPPSPPSVSPSLGYRSGYSFNGPHGPRIGRGAPPGIEFKVIAPGFHDDLP